MEYLTLEALLIAISPLTKDVGEIKRLLFKRSCQKSTECDGCLAFIGFCKDQPDNNLKPTVYGCVNPGAINNQTIVNQMNMTIDNSGSSNAINTGTQIHFENKVTLFKEDTKKLQNKMRQKGIDEADIAEIIEIVIAEKSYEENCKLGEKSNNWISQIINKSLNGIGKIATDVSVRFLSELIKQYYEMP